jgi:hypothetical protein
MLAARRNLWHIQAYTYMHITNYIKPALTSRSSTPGTETLTRTHMCMHITNYAKPALT